MAVIGAGPVGFFVAQSAQLDGAKEVLVLDLEPDRLALVENVGATPIDVKQRNPQMAVSERTEGRGADVVIEAVGSEPAFETAIEVVRRGGSVTIVGMFVTESMQIPLGFYWSRALDLRFAGICPVHAWWERSLEAVVEGRIDPKPIISHRLPLSDAPHGYELFESRRATKVVLTRASFWKRANQPEFSLGRSSLQILVMRNYRILDYPRNLVTLRFSVPT